MAIFDNLFTNLKHFIFLTENIMHFLKPMV